MISLTRVRTAVPLTGQLRGLIGREVLSAAPALGALLLLYLLLAFLPTINFLINNQGLHLPPASIFLNALTGALVAVFFLMGVLCGAEEEENGTTFFVRQLPVGPLRILAEKVLGSLIAIGLWFVVAWLAGTVLLLVFRTGTTPGMVGSGALLWGVLFFGFGLTAGVWIRRVLPAALAGGTAGVLFGWAALALGDASNVREAFIQHQFSIPFLASGALLALASAAWRVRHPEGVEWAARTPDLRWKEWRGRRWVTIPLAAALLLLPLPFGYLIEALQGYGVEDGPANAMLLLLAGAYIAVVTESVLLWTREEADRTRGYVYTLPIPPGAMLRTKLLSLARRLSIHAVVGSLLFVLLWWLARGESVLEDPGIVGAILILALTAIPGLALFAVTLRVYCKPLLLAGVMAALYLLILSPMIIGYVFATNLADNPLSIAGLWGWVWRQVVLCAALAAWLFWLEGHSAVHDHGPFARFGGAILYIITAAVASAFFLFADYRELLFILFGI